MAGSSQPIFENNDDEFSFQNVEGEKVLNLNLLKCANSSTDTKNPKKCHVPCVRVMCNVSPVTCHISLVACHILLVNQIWYSGMFHIIIFLDIHITTTPLSCWLIPCQQGRQMTATSQAGEMSWRSSVSQNKINKLGWLVVRNLVFKDCKHIPRHF